jgi:LysM repeat protein
MWRASASCFSKVAERIVVLFQGCGKDSNKTASNTETNSIAMSYPPDTNTASGSMFTPATNVPTTNFAAANTNFGTPAPAGAFGGLPSTGPGASLAGPSDAGIAAAGTTTSEPIATVPTKDYKIQSRDTLSGIATKNGVTLSSIMRVNPNLDPKKLKVGQSIKIPTASTAAPASAGGATMAAGTGSTPPTGTLGAAGAAAVTGTGGGTYKVKAGDTLTKIARAHGITVNQLRAANNMKTTQVQVGKVLKIPARSPQRTAAADTNTAHH